MDMEQFQLFNYMNNFVFVIISCISKFFQNKRIKKNNNNFSIQNFLK